MSRVLENGFLRECCKFTSDTEVPSIFSLWTAISCVSTALGRKCFVEMGHYNVYPNLYIVLVAGSAKCRKSTAIRIAEKLIKSVDPPINVLSQKMTPEALIEAINETPSTVEDAIITERAEGIILIDELSTLIDRNSFQSGLIPLLTTLWDSPDEFEYRTRARGRETLRNCHLSILGGSTAQWLKEAVPVVAIGGGFTSRILFVFQDRPEKLVAFPQMTDENKKRGHDLKRELNQIAKMKGQFYLSPSAKILFEEDYKTFSRESEFLDDKNLSGYAGRKHTILIKLAMVVSATERDTRTIHEHDLQIALRMLLNIEENLPRVMQAITSESVGDICEEVLKFIKQKKLVKRAVLMSKFSSRLTSRELAVILDTLMEMKVVVQDGMTDSPVLVYKGR